MTYRELLVELGNLSEKELDLDATVCVDGSEYYQVVYVDKAGATDVLDKGHPFLETDFL